MPATKLDSQKIKRNGWKQGACLLVDKKIEVCITTQCMQEQLLEGLYVVLSQDCDVLQASLEKEPVIELIRANEIGQCSPELTAGKNPRELHLQVGDEEASCFKLFPYERYFIARTYLEKLHANTIKIVDKPLKELIIWTVKRYNRPGFPDAFNSRINCKKTISKIKTIMREEAKNTLGVFIEITPEKELKSDKIYRIKIVMLVDKEIYEDEQERSKIHNGFDKILFLLDKIKGITVIDGSQVLSMDDISLHRFTQLKQWDFDYISFMDGGDGKTINDITTP